MDAARERPRELSLILVDFSQVFISNLMVSLNGGFEPNEHNVRAMVLNSLRFYNKKFGKEYGEMIICCDDKNFWRKEIFPHYKANRKRNRNESKLDWKRIFEVLDTIKAEIKENFHYRVVQADQAEADDVIAVLVTENSSDAINNGVKILIVSGDKDFVQLQRYPNVDQYDPVHKKKIIEHDPYGFIKEHIMRGDVGDGVPNFLSSDSCLVLGVRQTPISSKKLELWKEQDPSEFCTATTIRNYKRNESIIDLSKIPNTIRERVLESYESQSGKKKDRILPYIISKRLGELLNVIGDFS